MELLGKKQIVQKMNEAYDSIILGAGFFGLRIAKHLRSQGFSRILVLEAENEAMTRASYVNQARVHNGYHYPRSLLTAYRSRLSSRRFLEDYPNAIDKELEHVYAISNVFSRTNSQQFEEFCRRIGAPLRELPYASDFQFSESLIENAWLVEEFAFNAQAIRTELLAQIKDIGGIDLSLGQKIIQLSRTSLGISATLESGEKYEAPLVIACLYAGTNALHAASGLDLLPLQCEVAEMALVKVPKELNNRAITVMDGPFFSLMPFPSEDLYTFSHVRYTPQIRWKETDPAAVKTYGPRDFAQMGSLFREMKADAARYVRAISKIEYVKSIREIKTVLASVDLSDRRPVVVRTYPDLPGYLCVLGGKIDNIYDVLDELDEKIGIGRDLDDGT